jgi:voltage-dependent potassium channel beta subunit
MNYRRLGNSGLKLSELSFGSWVTYGAQLGDDSARECMAAAHDAGVNFFDNAEVYAKGKSEIIMGNVLKKLGWRRESYVVSTKFFWGLSDGPNEKNTLNRKYLMQAIDASLARLQLNHVDLVFCHRPDPDTPIDETVWAMHDMIRAGKAHYWGTSEWSAAEVMAAWQIAERHHLAKPVMEQPQYNLFHRQRVEREYALLYSDLGLGTTTWSPLASGLLSGKYNNGIPKDSRATLKGYGWLAESVLDPVKAEAGPLACPAGRRSGLHDGTARACMVPQEPERQQRHHRSEPPVAGHREHEGARRRSEPGRRPHVEDRCDRRRSRVTIR